MEKLVVYKACDGKLFEDDGKCISYEYNLKKILSKSQRYCY